MQRIEGYIVMTYDCPVTLAFSKQEALIAMKNLRFETQWPECIHAFHSWITLDDNNNPIKYEEYGV